MNYNNIKNDEIKITFQKNEHAIEFNKICSKNDPNEDEKSIQFDYLQATICLFVKF
jgi:hypothetical protein